MDWFKPLLLRALLLVATPCGDQIGTVQDLSYQHDAALLICSSRITTTLQLVEQGFS